jgi:beta-lactamase superfamily II metal-dependent hydrolase
VEVCVANHHAYYDAMGVPFLQAVRPQVMIIQLWSAGQPGTKVLAGMLSENVYRGNGTFSRRT